MTNDITEHQALEAVNATARRHHLSATIATIGETIISIELHQQTDAGRLEFYGTSWQSCADQARRWLTQHAIQAA